MATYNTNQLRIGTKLLIDSEPCIIIENEFVKPGKGQAFARVKYRNLLTGRVNERTYKSGESVEGADVHETDVQYLYNDGDDWHFMDNNTYEQCSLDKNVLGDAIKWLKEEHMCEMLYWNGAPLSVKPPNFVILKITGTDPGVRGDTSGGGSKPATLETGVVVRVPLFIEVGESIKVDTRTGEYVERAKE